MPGTDKLRSYDAAHRMVMPSVQHRYSKYLNTGLISTASPPVLPHELTASPLGAMPQACGYVICARVATPTPSNYDTPMKAPRCPTLSVLWRSLDHSQRSLRSAIYTARVT